MPTWRLGTVGFSYSEWSGIFYPRSLKPGDYLSFYAQHFDAVELDTTFHAVPPPDRVRRWADATPGDFRFAVKAPRAVTHDAPLDQGLVPMLSFLDAMRELGDKLAVVLLQFPPTFAANHFQSLDDLLGKMPADVRFAVEFRHPSWRSQRTADILARHRAAWVSVDHARERAEVRPTTDFLYLRCIGEHDRFTDKNWEQLDATERLEWWKAKIAAAPRVNAVYAFFNNDYAGYSVATCDRMKRVLGLPVPPILDTRGEGQLFG